MGCDVHDVRSVRLDYDALGRAAGRQDDQAWEVVRASTPRRTVKEGYARVRGSALETVRVGHIREEILRNSSANLLPALDVARLLAYPVATPLQYLAASV